MVSVPARVAPEFAAMLKLTVPLPVPVLPAMIVIQESRLAAVHAQPDPELTATVPDPPPAATVWLDVARE
jgi:hypothetical protein